MPEHNSFRVGYVQRSLSYLIRNTIIKFSWPEIVYQNVIVGGFRADSKYIRGLIGVL